MTPIHFTDLGLDPILLQAGPFAIRWYSLAYIGGVLWSWWYMLRLLKASHPPLTGVQMGAFVNWLILGVVVGGRLGYVLFYNPERYLHDPVSALYLWEGGMSFHGGIIGVSLAILLFAKRHKIPVLRFMDYIAVTAPFGLFWGRIANFINGELWGKPTDGSWGIIFPTGGPMPRHPSQLYEAILEGPVLFAILWCLFWTTQARLKPGMLAGAFGFSYGCFRFIIEHFRSPDPQLVWLAEQTGLQMGQWLSLPMILLGIWLMASANSRHIAPSPPA